MKMKIEPRPCEETWRAYKNPPGIFCEQIIDGWLRTWEEYVPKCYDGSVPVPLVLSVHGAAHHTADRYTAWQLIAERENFIVVYPHCLIEEIKFNVWDSYSASDGMPDDVAYIDQLIDIIIKKYNIDETRIYIQGQSVGDNMVSTYILAHGDRVAAAAPLSGPASSSVLVSPETGTIIRRPIVPVPVIRTHGSEDTDQPLGALGRICIMGSKGEEKARVLTDEARKLKWIIGQRLNIEIWRNANGCSELPKISMFGRYNWLVYEGKPCDFVFYIVQGGEHGPYLDMADNLWTYFFRKYRRVNGEIIKDEIAGKIEEDVGAIALAAGANEAYVNNQRVAVDSDGHEIKVIDGIFYAPISFVPVAIPDAQINISENGEVAEIIHKGDQVQVAMGNRVVVYNEHLRDLPRTLVFEGILYVPIAEIMSLLLGFQASTGYNTLYLCQRGGIMTYDLAYVIREILGKEPNITPAQTLQMEQDQQKGKGQFAAHTVMNEKYYGTEEEVFSQLKEKYESNLHAYLEKRQMK